MCMECINVCASAFIALYYAPNANKQKITQILCHLFATSFVCLFIYNKKISSGFFSSHCVRPLLTALSHSLLPSLHISFSISNCFMYTTYTQSDCLTLKLTFYCVCWLWFGLVWFDSYVCNFTLNSMRQHNSVKNGMGGMAAKKPNHVLFTHDCVWCVKTE